MSDIWGDFEADVAAIIGGDGDTVTWQVGINDHSVVVFWQADSVEDEGMGPRFEIATADIPADASHGDLIVRDSVEYEVRRFLPDGHGLTLVLLVD
jgi:hypothetical protein